MNASAMRATGLRSLLLFCAAIAFAAGSASAQNQVFVTLDGISGDSKVKGFEGAIAADSVQVAVTNAYSVSSGGTASRPQFSDIVITKPLDSASPRLIASCAGGQHLKSAVISVTRSSERGVTTYIRYTLSDVVVTSVSESASSGGPPAEQVSLSFGRIDIEYIPVDATGKTGAPIKTSYDLKQNKVVSAGRAGEAMASSEAGAALDWQAALLRIFANRAFAVRMPA